MVAREGPALREALEYVLLANPGQTARHLVTRLRGQGLEVDKSRVNSVLYRYSDTFRNDGSVPPRWSLADASPQIVVRRAPHRVSGVGLANWKVFDHAVVPMSGVTLLYGENSAGKSSILQALLLMKQSWGHGDLQLEGSLASFGWYQHVIHGHDVDRDLGLMAFWDAPDGGDENWSVALGAKSEDLDFAYSPEHALSHLRCQAANETITLWPVSGDRAGTGELAGGWLAVRMDRRDTADLVPEELVQRGQAVVLGSDELGFPDVEDVLGAATSADGSHTAAVVETVDTIREVLDGAGAMFDAIVHIGPYRKVPQRDIRMSWALAEADYLARLAQEGDLLADVNEWLTRFEVPYAVEIARYGDDEGDEVFELNLVRAGGSAETVQLRDVGFGVSQLLPIIAQLLGNREKTILIEEPEAHVHPRLQSVLGDLFMTSMQDYGNVLVVETHSEPILLRLQRRVAEGRIDHEDVAVVHVIRHGDSSEVEGVPVEENGQLDYRWPGGFFDDRMDDLVAILDPQPDE